MTEINIQEFSGYDLDEINKFLTIQKDNNFEINVPKEGVVFQSDHNELAWEYAIAAYVGQRLSEISSEFEYGEPSMSTPGDFYFTIKTDKLKELANVLLLISGGFGNSENMEPIDLASEVSDFIKKSSGLDLACPDYIDTYIEYYTPEEGEDD